MEFISQDDKCLGNPAPCFKETNDIAPSPPTNNIQYNTQESSVSEESNNSTEIITIDQLSSLGSTRYFHFELLSILLFHYFY